MEKDYSGELRTTTLTLAISAAACAIGVISVVMSIVAKNFSFVGIIVAGAMLFNMIITLKRRRAIKEAMGHNPKL